MEYKAPKIPDINSVFECFNFIFISPLNLYTALIITSNPFYVNIGTIAHLVFFYEGLFALIECQNVIEHATRISPVFLFRPPLDKYNATLLKTTINVSDPWGIMWSIDTIDWNSTPADTMISKALNNAQPVSIVLIHVCSGTNIPSSP